MQTLSDDLKGLVEQKYIDDLNRIGGSANAAIVKAMGIGDRCRQRQ